MKYYTILMPREYAWEILNELGEIDALQFTDLNSGEAPFNKPYSNYLKRCDEMETKIQIIKKEMERFKVPISECHEMEVFLENLKKFLSERNKAERTYFDEVETELGEKLKSLNEQIKIRDTLIERFDHLVEYRQVLLRAYSFIGGSGDISHDLGEASEREFRRDDEETKTNFRSTENIRFTYLAGVINKEDSLRFKRILFRVTRGMTWTTLMDIDRPRNENERSDFDHLIDTSSETKQKTVFLIVYQGGSHEMMAKKLNKICDSFGASKYGLPSERSNYDKKLKEVESQLKEAKSVVLITEKHIKSILDQFSKPRRSGENSSLITELKMFILKEKIIYDNLNKLKSQNTLYKGCCWCPSKLVPKVCETINNLKKISSIGGCEFQETQKPIDSQPPTHFETNKVTWIFQEIVDTYGIPRYREINPGIFTIVTFPFLFGVMFGDIGHGLLLLLAGVYLVLFKSLIEQDKESIWRLAIPARYLILFQGFFALYCGLIYNDFMSLPFNIFGTCYTKTSQETIERKADCTYPFGIDPYWGGKENELTFMNSFKMKAAIVIGVFHMIFGILLRGLNNIRFRSWIDFFCEFLPMLVFMSLTFGYMVALIFLKWSLPWGTEEYPISKSPSIIAIFIKMVLQPGVWPDDVGIPLYGDRAGTQQATMQNRFLIIVAICAAMILIPKPLLLWYKHKKSMYNLLSNDHEKSRIKNLLHHEEFPHDIGEEHKDEFSDNKLLDNSRSNSSFSHLEQEHFEFGEVIVHQVIETIEFILGSISNTASYLRLWALSLAHSQLAKVFFDNCLKTPMQNGNIIGIVIGFNFFAQFTFGILLMMDQMECFLHALRLHWVEFQNKFYKADGYKFFPFSYSKAISKSEDH